MPPRTFGFPAVGGRRDGKGHEVDDGAGDSAGLDGTGRPLKGSKPHECVPAETSAGCRAEQTAEVV